MSGKRMMGACLAVVTAVSVASCQARPGDAPTVEEEDTTTSTPAPLNKDERGKGTQITVGVDAFTSNLNPHLAGNESPLVSAIADLTLPSAFVPGPGGLVQDKNLLSEVTPNDPHAPTSIRYKLNPQAQWSDGTPVTSNDFEYLARAMAVTPGVEGADGYRRIGKFESQGSATEFTVTMTEPYVAWKELFRHVLPSHIYRAENHVFGTMMNNASAASAGAYMVSAVDSGRGIVELQRNDRYWGANPAQSDKLSFTAVPDTATGAQMLRTGQIQMLSMRPVEQSQLAIQQLQGVQQRSAGYAVQLNLTANLRSEVMRDPKGRAKIMGALDRDVITKVVSKRAEAPKPKWDIMPEVTGQQLAQEKKSQPQPVTIGVNSDDVLAVNAARTAADQLIKAGFKARVKTMEDNELHTTAIPEGSVDMVVHWENSPVSPAQYADQFGCAAAGVATTAKGSPNKTGNTAASTATEDTSDKHSTTEEPTTAPSASATSASDTSNSDQKTPAGTSEQAGPGDGDSGVAQSKPVVGNNISGYCAPEIDDMLERALTNHNDQLFGAQERIDSTVAAQNIVLPLLGEQQLVAVNDMIQGPSADLADWPFSPVSGVFPTAARWALRDGQSETTKTTNTPSSTSEGKKP